MIRWFALVGAVLALAIFSQGCGAVNKAKDAYHKAQEKRVEFCVQAKQVIQKLEDEGVDPHSDKVKQAKVKYKQLCKGTNGKVR